MPRKRRKLSRTKAAVANRRYRRKIKALRARTPSPDNVTNQSPHPSEAGKVLVPRQLPVRLSVHNLDEVAFQTFDALRRSLPGPKPRTWSRALELAFQLMRIAVFNPPVRPESDATPVKPATSRPASRKKKPNNLAATLK